MVDIKKYKSRKKNNINVLVKYIPRIFFALIVLTAFCLGWLKLRSPNTLPFKDIEIQTTANHIQPTVLKSIIKNNIVGGFFSLNTTKLKKSILTLPWVDEVSIRREWPGTLKINVIEQQAIARWNKQTLVNDRGELFTPPLKTIPKQLPMLTGPTSAFSQILQRFQKYNATLAIIGLNIKQLQLSVRLSWRLQLKNGIWITLGRNQVDARLLRFVNLYSKVIGKKAQRVVSVDMRYPNGMAVKWAKK